MDAIAGERHLPACRDRLRAVAFEIGGSDLAALVDRAKLLRASLVLACGASLGAALPALEPGAVSIELLHLASLVHDDIIDEAAERRGLPALHVTIGRDRALVVGDILITAAFAELGGGSPRALAASIDALSRGARLCGVGALQELVPRPLPPSEDEYLSTIAKKSGSLFAVAASLGALAAGANDADVAALSDIGTHFGVVYQIHDDMRDEPTDVPSAATYARATEALTAALAHAPSAAEPALRALLDAIRPIMA